MSFGQLHTCERPPYTYKRLGAGEIRLLKLYSAQIDEDEFRAELHHVELTPKLEFFAVSYVWGEQKFPNVLHMQAPTILKITRTLHDALKRFRQRDVPVMLWVDAVCINQGDIEERSSQIPSMGFIYTYAQKVLAWLGSATGLEIDVEKIQLAGAMAFFGRGLLRPGTSLHLLSDLEQLIADVVENQSERWTRVFETASMDSKLDPCGLKPLLMSPWFTRMWIVQEVALSKQVVLHFGRVEISWHDFERIMVIIWLYIETTNPVELSALNHFRQFCWPLVRVSYMVRCREGGARSLAYQIDWWFTSMASFGQRACLSDHDRVYALLGLCPSPERVQIKVDYSKTPSQLYTETALTAFRNGVLQNLYSAGLWRRNEHDLANTPADINYLPSWVPDLRSAPPTDGTVFWKQNGYDEDQLFDGALGETMPFGVLDTDECVIGMDATFLGTVERCWMLEDFTSGRLATTYGAKSESLGTDEQVVDIIRTIISACGSQTGRAKCGGLDDLPWDVICSKTLVSCGADINSLWSGYAKMQGLDQSKSHDVLHKYVELIIRQGDLQWLRVTETDSTETRLVKNTMQFLHGNMKAGLLQHIFFLTKEGLFGVAPFSAAGCHKGDMLVFFRGYTVPFLLRLAKHRDHMVVVVCPTYVECLMKLPREREQIGNEITTLLV